MRPLGTAPQPPGGVVCVSRQTLNRVRDANAALLGEEGGGGGGGGGGGFVQKWRRESSLRRFALSHLFIRTFTAPGEAHSLGQEARRTTCLVFRAPPGGLP